MVFNSYTFVAFILIVFFLYFQNFNWRIKKLFILVMSYIFYAAWNAPYVLIIIFSTVVDYVAARKIASSESLMARRAWLAVSLTGNLGVLSFFKYGEFVRDNFVTLVAQFGITYEPAAWNILLPVGISFYTFQTLTYSLDTYHRRMTPNHNFLDFALFVTYFPQLVAGPIVRARTFMPQLAKMPKITAENFGWGLFLFVLGLFEKTVLADAIFGPVTDRVFEQEGTLPILTVMTANLAFLGQVFADFSGYSMMAIGVSLCMGFHLPENFRGPFASIGYREIWGRWHISMSEWFRDYLYNYVKSEKRSVYRTMWAQIVTMTLIGLWHGAGWTFVLWGFYNGMFIAIELFLRVKIGAWRIWSLGVSKVGLWAFTFFMFSQSTFLFRSKDMQQAYDMLASFFVTPENNFDLTRLDFVLVGGTISALIASHFWIKHVPLRERFAAVPMPVVAGLVGVMLTCVAMVGRGGHGFIYFQF